MPTEAIPLLDAVQRVLDKADVALRVEEITKRVLASGLWQTKGVTPVATVHARLAMDVKSRGDSSRFVRTAPSTFALRSALPTTAKAAFKAGDKANKPAGPMSFTDAAEGVLKGSLHHEPLHYKAIVKNAIARGWLVTRGKTPDATLYVSLISEIERAAKRGETPRFFRRPKGYFGLSQWTVTPLESEIEIHNRKVRADLLVTLHSMPPSDFESLVSQLLVRLGFEDVSVTSYSNDGGIDVRGTLVVAGTIRTRMAVQVKRWTANVQSPTVQQVRGSLGSHDQGLIITTSDFGKGARDEANRPDAVPVALISGAQLVGLLAEYQVGIRRTSHDLLALTSLELMADSPEAVDG